MSGATAAVRAATITLFAGAVVAGTVSTAAAADRHGNDPRLPRCADVTPVSKPATREQRQAQRQLSNVDWLAGDWAGSGWFGADTPTGRFNQTEVIRYEGAGDILTVHGTGRSPADPGRVLFAAVAKLSWDSSRQQLLWDAQTNGNELVVPFTVTSDGWSWGYGDGADLIRYTTTTNRAGTTWHEIGESSSDGGVTWHQFHQQDLTKTCDAGIQPRGHAR